MSRHAYKRTYSWSQNMAYLVGLMASDGCLLSDGRHLDITSADIEQLQNFSSAIGRKLPISVKRSGPTTHAYRTQFSDVALYDFLVACGLTPKKSHSINQLRIPNEFYPDFVRGLFDGDGTCWTYKDKRWPGSNMFYSAFSSGSRMFLDYLQQRNHKLAGIKGSISAGTRCYMLRYAKTESKLLYEFMYYADDILSLTRKRTKLEGFISDRTVVE